MELLMMLMFGVSAILLTKSAVMNHQTLKLIKKQKSSKNG